MTKAIFYKSGNTFRGFEISGHAMLNVDAPDPLCAAISGMTSLVMNTLCEVFGVSASVELDEDAPSVEFYINSCKKENESAACGIIKGFMLQLQDLQSQYPDNLCVMVQQNTTKGTKEK